MDAAYRRKIGRMDRVRDHEQPSSSFVCGERTPDGNPRQLGDMEMLNSLYVSSIFTSIDGEVNAFHQGAVTTFIRLSGCNLRCSYCDTKHAQIQGDFTMTVEAVYRSVLAMDTNKVTITGGEPLLQTKGVVELVAMLAASGYRVTIETNGSLVIDCSLFDNASFIVDWKLSSSKMATHMEPQVFMNLRPTDFVKFVIGDRNDFYRAIQVKNQLRSDGCCATFAFSPMHNGVSPAELVQLMIDERQYDTILNLQIHKIIWPDAVPGEEH